MCGDAIWKMKSGSTPRTSSADPISKGAKASGSEASDRLKSAIAMAGDGVWDWDLVRNRVDFSPRWKHMLGFEDHEISDSVSEWSDRVHPDDLPTAQNAVREQ